MYCLPGILRSGLHRLNGPNISRRPSALRPLKPRPGSLRCKCSILTWLNGGKALASAEDLGKVKDEVGKLKDELGEVKDGLGKLKDELGEVKDGLDEVKKQVAGLRTDMGRLNESDMREKASKQYFVGESIEIGHMEGLAG